MDEAGIDRVLLFAILALTLIGLVMVYSSSYAIATEIAGAKSPSFFLRRHIVRLMLGFLLLYVFTRVGERPLRTLARESSL